MDDIGAVKAIQDGAFGDEAADKDIRLVYDTGANVAVFRRDLLCMKVGGWIKDKTVNIYMALLQVTLPFAVQCTTALVAVALSSNP